MNAFKIVFKYWYSWLIAIFFAFFYMLLLQLTKNLSFSWMILTSGNLNAGDKIGFVWQSFLSIFSIENLSVYNILVVFVGVCCSIVLTFSLFIKVIKKKELEKKMVCKIDRQAKVTSFLGTIISFFAVGCVGCQTALISPIIALLTAGTAAIFLGEIISVFVLLIALILSVYSIIRLTAQLKGVKI
jgi:hypothetical protein